MKWRELYMKTNAHLSSLVLLRVRNVSERVVQKKSKYALHFSKNPTVYEIMWKTVLEPDRSQMTL